MSANGWRENIALGNEQFAAIGAWRGGASYQFAYGRPVGFGRTLDPASLAAFEGATRRFAQHDGTICVFSVRLDFQTSVFAVRERQFEVLVATMRAAIRFSQGG